MPQLHFLGKTRANDITKHQQQQRHAATATTTNNDNDMRQYHTIIIKNKDNSQSNTALTFYRAVALVAHVILL
jgi:hypothetical protein